MIKDIASTVINICLANVISVTATPLYIKILVFKVALMEPSNNSPPVNP
jgi:hypothetical protein